MGCEKELKDLVEALRSFTIVFANVKVLEHECEVSPHFIKAACESKEYLTKRLDEIYKEIRESTEKYIACVQGHK